MRNRLILFSVLLVIFPVLYSATMALKFKGVLRNHANTEAVILVRKNAYEMTCLNRLMSLKSVKPVFLLPFTKTNVSIPHYKIIFSQSRGLNSEDLDLVASYHWSFKAFDFVLDDQFNVRPRDFGLSPNEMQECYEMGAN